MKASVSITSSEKEKKIKTPLLVDKYRVVIFSCFNYLHLLTINFDFFVLQREDADQSYFDVVLTYVNGTASPCKLTLFDVTRLMPNRYIFPEVIRFAFYYAMNERMPKTTRAKLVFFDPVDSPISSYLDLDTEAKNKFHERYPLQGKQWLVMPTLWEGTSQKMPHWYLAIVNNIHSNQSKEEKIKVSKNKCSKIINTKVTFFNSKNPIGAVHYKTFSCNLRGFLADAHYRATGVRKQIFLKHEYPKKLPQQGTEDDSGFFCVEYFVSFFKSPLPADNKILSEKEEEKRLKDVLHLDPSTVTRTKYQLIIYQLVTDQEKRAKIAKHLNWNVLKVPKNGLMMVNGTNEQRVTANQLVSLLNTGNIVPGCAASNNSSSTAPRAIAIAIDQPVPQNHLPKNSFTTTIERVDSSADEEDIWHHLYLFSIFCFVY